MHLGKMANIHVDSLAAFKWLLAICYASGSSFTSKAVECQWFLSVLRLGAGFSRSVSARLVNMLTLRSCILLVFSIVADPTTYLGQSYLDCHSLVVIDQLRSCGSCHHP